MAIRRLEPTRGSAPKLQGHNVLATGALSAAMLGGMVALMGVPRLSAPPPPIQPALAVALAPELEEDRPATYVDRDLALEAKMWAILRVPTVGDPLTHEQLVARVAALGPEVVPLVFALLTGEVSVPALQEGAGAEGTTSPGQVVARQDRVLLQALSKLPSDAVHDHLRTAATGAAPLDVRMLAARVLEGIDDVRSVDLLMDVMTEIETIHLHRTYVQRPFESALTAILVRHVGAYRRLEERFPDLDSAQLSIVVRALPQQRAQAGVELTLALLDRDEELDVLALRKLSSLLGSVDAWVGERALQRVRAYLGHGESDLRREAAVALGTIHDTESIDALIGLLDYPDRRVQDGALWSLRHMSGERIEPNSEHWRLWWEQQKGWLETVGLPLEHDIYDPEPALALAAMRQLAQKPLFKHRFSAALGGLVKHENPNIAQTACRMLAQLGSPRALPFLLDGLEQMNDETAAASLTALRALTGRELSGDRRAWEKALGA